MAGDKPPGALRQRIRETARGRGALKAKHHLQSLLFGLGFGGLVVLIILFGFFNEVVIAPFIQPSRKVSATPIIVSGDGVATSDKDEVVIPKINVQIPLDFSATTTDEKEFEAALDKGVSHYPTTALPGQQGNASFFGHSSNNIFNPGKYKFAFVLLNELVPGDTFYLNYKGVSYAYQVYDKKIVEATDVQILNPVPDKSATAMLVTCDPPGTSLRRLAVWGEQISPNPTANTAATPEASAADSNAKDLPGNGPTLWRRLVDTITGD
jgi:sortase A